MAEQTPDNIITTQRNGQTIVAELFFYHSSTETFRDKLLKLALARYSRAFMRSYSRCFSRFRARYSLEYCRW